MNFLTNTKMGRLVLGLFGAKDLPTDKDGKIILTDEQKEAIRANYGAEFLKKFEATNFVTEEESESSARDLFDAAVAYQTAAKDKQIAALQKDVLRLSQESEPAPRAEFGGETKAPYKVNMAASHNKLVDSVMQSGNLAEMNSITAGTLDVTDLNKEFKGALPTGARLELLTKQIYAGFDDAKYMTRIQSNTDYIATEAIFTEISQQFSDVWTPKGSGDFTPCRIAYRRHKINVPLKPASIVQSWLVTLYEQGKTLQEMPITKYLIANHILPKVLDDITRSMLGKGKYKAVEISTLKDGQAGSPAKDSMDGLETILVEARKTDGCNMHFFKGAKNPLTLGQQELLDYVNSFADAISENFAGNMPIYCSPELLTRYQRADFAINGKYTGQEVGTAVRFTNFTLIPLKCMYSSPILFATPKENLVELVDYTKAESVITKVEEYHYNVDITGEYSLSVGFKIEEAVWASVPADYDPATTIHTGETASDQWQGGSSSSPAMAAVEGA